MCKGVPTSENHYCNMQQHLQSSALGPSQNKADRRDRCSACPGTLMVDWAHFGGLYPNGTDPPLATMIKASTFGVRI